MKNIYIAALFLGLTATAFAQTKSVGINTSTPDANSDLTLGSTNKGLLLNRVALTGTNDATTVGAHTAGMVVYNTATAGTGATAVTPGEYCNDGTKWVKSAVDYRMTTVSVKADGTGDYTTLQAAYDAEAKKIMNQNGGAAVTFNISGSVGALSARGHIARIVVNGIAGSSAKISNFNVETIS